MFAPNPFGPQPDPNQYSYTHLKKRILQDIKAAKIDDQIFELVQKAYEAALKQGNVVVLLPGLEKQRLLAEIMNQVLSDMIQKLDGKF
jgi:hypothetical protein